MGPVLASGVLGEPTELASEDSWAFAMEAAMTPKKATKFVFDRSLREFAYRCWPDGCPRGRTCCVGLTVEVSRKEIGAIDSMMDELTTFVPGLRDDEGYIDAFAEDSPQWIIDSGESGACPFLLKTKKHSLCSIHHRALETGRSVPAVKPAACRHWPILLRSEGSRIRVLVQPAAENIGCVGRRSDYPDHPSVLEAYREELVEICGESEVARRLPKKTGGLA